MRLFSAKWNHGALRPLWFLVVVGMLACLPMIGLRYQTETSAKPVDIVYDYRDLIDMSQYQPDANRFIEDSLQRLKAAGVTSLAVYESTLDELQKSGRVMLYASSELPQLTGAIPDPNENFTYVLFADEQTRSELEPLIRSGFGAEQITVRDWAFRDKKGLVVEAPLAEALTQPMDPDPLAMQRLRGEGFHLVVRLSDVRTFDSNRMDKLLAELHGLDVKWLAFKGDAVTGFAGEASKRTLHTMGYLLNKYGIGVAVIEQPIEKQPKGMAKIASLTGYNAVRLHSILERESFDPVSKLADRMTLAVSDRGIRMIYLNGEEERDPLNEVMVNSIDNMIKALHEAVPRIEAMGHPLGAAQPFTLHQPDWQKYLKLIAAIGAVALMALTAGVYFPRLRLPASVVGWLGTAGLYVLSPSLTLKALALGAAICAPTLAVIFAIRSVAARRGRAATEGAKAGFAVWLLFRTALLSLIGVVFTVGLLNYITFALVLEQFRGVSLLHLAPILLIGLYALVFHETSSLRESGARVRAILLYKINVLLVAAGVIGLGMIYYYLTRTGNAGTASGLELKMRAALEHLLVVRPRTKELLLHPMLVLGAYLSFRYRHAVYLFVLAVIAQLSIDDTFAHLHTPMLISLIRVTYGVVFGAVIGLALIVIWRWLERGYRRWAAVR